MVYEEELHQGPNGATVFFHAKQGLFAGNTFSSWLVHCVPGDFRRFWGMRERFLSTVRYKSGVLLLFSLSLLLCLVLSAGSCPAANDEKAAAASTAQAKDKELTPEEEQKLKEAKAEAEAKAQEALKAKEERAAELREEQDAAAEKKRQEAAEIAQDDPLKDIWAGQRTMIDAVIKESASLSESFLSDTSVLEQIRPVEQDIRRLLIMVNEFKQWPSPLEAVSRRLSISADLVHSILLTAAGPQLSARKLLEQLDSSVESMAELSGSHVDETAEYLSKINTARFLLTAVITRYTSALAPASALLDRVKATRAEISKKLPELWMNYYTQAPVAWLSASEWASVPRNLSYFTTGLSLRKSVELPLTNSQWQGAAVRFIITFLSIGSLSVLLVNQFLQGMPKAMQQVKRYSLPWNVLGVSLIAASYSQTIEPFRLFMALGNISLIFGQSLLAWELRRIKFPEVTVDRSPLLALMPLTICAYVFIYLPLPRLVTLILWLTCVIISIWRCRKTPKLDLGKMQMEHSIRDMQPLVLWPCLILCLVGFHFYSMALYLLYSSVSIAIQISVASLSVLSRLNESLNNDDTRTMFASFILALAAPVVLLLSVAIVSLWLATLPGGMDLLQFYIFKSVNIGSTQLNLVQVLLIATAFFLARTAARMGKNFIAKLPSRGVKVDPSLITPMQTGYTYVVWCLFGFFVLRSLGMNLSNLAVVAGGLSVGIGFGLQTIVNNFISGIILIFSRTLQVGDVVEVGTVVGRIKQISVRATQVETYDSAVIYVPNSAFVSGNLTNWTSNSRTTRQQVVVGVAYGSDPQKVSKILLDIANKQSDILAYPQPVVQFQNFGASTMDFRLLFWVRDYDLGLRVASDIRYAINARFAAEKIEIAFPQMDVHLKQDAAPARRTSSLPQPKTGQIRRQGRPRRVIARKPL